VKHNQNRKRQFETLETRTLMAGNVTAAVAGGNLTITGDKSANIISVTELSNNRWQIIGGATKINGKNQTFVTDPVTGSVTISMQGGNDSLVLHNASVDGGHLTILMGDGNDTATLTNVDIGTFLHFEGNSGNDVLAINNVHVSDPTFEFFSTIDMQDGNDVVSAHGFFDQDLQVTLGSGKDTFVLDNSKFLGGPFQRLRIDAGDGTDVVSLVSVQTGPLFVDMGPGKNDVLSIVNSKADSATLLDTDGKSGIISGAGNDFGTQTIDANFTYRSGDLTHDKVVII
jgi:hypothetical protein